MATTSSEGPTSTARGKNPAGIEAGNFESSTRGSFDPVFRAELEEIAGRRLDSHFNLPEFDLDNPSAELQGIIEELNDPEQNKLWSDAKTQGICESGLTGVALSGGGIRSSTFNLGVLQVLDRVGLFKHFDYMSTVSGGGYIGTYVSTCMLEDAKQGKANEFPLRHKTGTEESDRFRHLRNYASFLNPGGNSELLAIPIVLLRGIVINFLSLLPFLLLIAAGLAYLIDPATWAYPWTKSIYSGLSETSLVEKELLLFLFSRYPISLGILTSLTFLFALYPLVQKFDQRFSRLFEWDTKMWLQIKRELTLSMLIMVLFGLFAAVLFELQPLILELMQGVLTNGWTATIAASATLTTLFSDKVMVHLKGWAAKFGVALFGLIGILVFWLILLWFSLQMMNVDAQGPSWEISVVLLIAAITLVFTQILVDVNFTSLHKYYRDKLTRAFVRQADPDLKNTKGVPNLSDLDTSRAPYQLINVAVNVQREKLAYRTGRKASFFFFAKRYCGGIRTSYCKTDDLEAIAPNLDVGTAMAISGAAIAPNMGKFTNPMLTFIMAMLNLRLNYWLANPLRSGSNGSQLIDGKRVSYFGVGPFYLFAEMFRNLHRNMSYVNLSDGGHIENLGVYELLRRQCRLIVAGDGECDGKFTYQGLAEVIRMARIDFGFQIEMDGLDEIRSGEQQYAIGRIRYADNRQGLLIYLKSNLGGDYNLQAALDSEEKYRTSPERDDNYLFDHSAYVAHYRDNHRDFPNESTADQFFDETQFESYRSLGYQVAASALLAPWSPDYRNLEE